jgi:hypothetical protein
MSQVKPQRRTSSSSSASQPATAAAAASAVDLTEAYVDRLQRRLREAALKRHATDNVQDAAELDGKLRALQASNAELKELARAADALHDGTHVLREADRDVLARCIGRVKELSDSSRARLRERVAKLDELKRKAARYEADIMRYHGLTTDDPRPSAQGFEAEGEAANGSDVSSNGADIAPCNRPLTVHAPPPPVNDSDWIAADHPVGDVTTTAPAVSTAPRSDPMFVASWMHAHAQPAPRREPA